MIKYISSTFIFINAIFVFLATNEISNFFFVAVVYLIITGILCFSLFFAIRTQILKKANYFSTGNTVIDEIKDDWNQNGIEHNETTLSNKKNNYYSDFVDELENVNNDRADKIKDGQRDRCDVPFSGR